MTTTLGGCGDPDANVQVTLDVICAQDPTGASTVTHLAGLLYLRPSITVDLDVYYGLTSAVQRLPALRVVLLCFDNFFVMQRAVAAYPIIREPLSSTNDFTYQFICRQSDEHPFEEVPRATSHGWNWESVGISPLTMKPTGISIFLRLCGPVLT